MKEKSKGKLLWDLFVEMLYLSAFTFGGGYVIITLMQRSIVEKRKWIDKEEMLDLVAIAQSSPGPIAINGAVSVGYKLAGFIGVLVAVTGAVIPPFTIISIVSFFYKAFITNPYIALLMQGMQAGVAAVIFAVVYDMAKDVIKQKKPFLMLIMVLAFIANYFFDVSAAYIVLICIGIGVIMTYLEKKKGAEK